MSPILVVGAGPVGLTLAAELARYGVAVRLIDKSAKPTQTSKALVVWSRTLELMDRMGCTPVFLDAGLHARGATIRKGTSTIGHTTFDTIASAYNFALMIPQSETERLLTAHLGSLGVTIEREVELTGFSAEDDQVSARLRHPDGREEAIETPWLVGCDGAHSPVRHGLGVEFRGAAEGDDWLLADVRLEGEHAARVGRARHLVPPRWARSSSFRCLAAAPGWIGTLGKTDPRPPTPRPDARRRSGDGGRPRRRRLSRWRPDLAHHLPHQRAQGRRLQGRPRVPGRGTRRTSTAPPAARA